MTNIIPEELQAAVDLVGTVLGLGLGLANPNDLVLLSEAGRKNARYMSQHQYQTLVKNIKSDGQLSSVPLVHKEEDGTLVVLSGNHRVQAARDAGITLIPFMYKENLSKGEQIAEQIAHNAISGEDDQQLLKSLWDEIDNLHDKERTGMDSALLKELENAEFEAISPAKIEMEVIQLLFLPTEVQEFHELVMSAKLAATAKETYLVALHDYDHVLKELKEVKKVLDIKNTTVAFSQLIEWAVAGKEQDEDYKLQKKFFDEKQEALAKEKHD